MKRIASLLPLLLLAAVACFPLANATPPGNPTTAAPSVAAPPQIPVAWIYRGDAPRIPVTAASPVTPKTREAAIERICGGNGVAPSLRSGDFVLLDYGQFGPFPHLVLPDGVKFRGMGMDETVLFGNVVSDNVGTNFALQNSTLEEMTLKNDCSNPGEDGRCVGFDNGAFGVGPGPFSATIRRCRLWCRDWTVYCWSPNNKLELEDCEIVTGRVGIAAENSGDGQDVCATRCKILGDASLSNSIGATSTRSNGGVFGCIARGGPLKLIDCEIDLKGRSQADQDKNQSWTPRICGIVDRGGGGDGPGGNTRISIYNLRCHIDPNGADPTKCFDLNLEFDYVQKPLRVNFSNCWGSAADGSLSKSFSN